MPNWCENHLEITGPREEIGRMFREVRGEVEFDFEMILPTPPEMAPTGSSTAVVPGIPGGTMPDWWDWRTSFSGWSTKWGVEIDHVENLPDGVRCSFQSAWSPPESIVYQLGMMYPLLRFSLLYAEGGSFFAGVLTLQGDRILENESYDSTSSDQLYSFVKERLGQDWQEWEEEDE